MSSRYFVFWRLDGKHSTDLNRGIQGWVQGTSPQTGLSLRLVTSAFRIILKEWGGNPLGTGALVHRVMGVGAGGYSRPRLLVANVWSMPLSANGRLFDPKYLL